MTAHNKHIQTKDIFKAACDSRKNWQDFDQCCLDVSLLNRYQQDEYLITTLKWINDRFDSCIINLGDTLHRHNLLHEHGSMNAAHQKAYQLGDEWILKNSPLLKTLEVPFKIIRNDDWLEHDDFKAVHSELWDFYQNDPVFHEIVNNDIETFVGRQKDTSPEIVREASLSYLLEETAADILLGKQGGVAHLYPGNRFNSYWYLTDNAHSIPSVLNGLENSAFKRLSPSHIMRRYKNRLSHRLVSKNKDETIGFSL